MEGVNSTNPVYIPTGRLWPCRDFSLGTKKTRPDERVDLDTFRLWEREGALDVLPGQEYGRYGVPEGRAEPLDLSNLPNSHKATGPKCTAALMALGKRKAKRPETYGRKGITGYGKKMVKSVGALIDRAYPHHRVTFCTVTMPDLPSQLRRELALSWPELVRQLLQWLKRRLGKAGLPKVVVSVSEIQPGRLEHTGEGYLHLHILWLNLPGKRGNWAVDVVGLRSWVSEFLQKRNLWTVDSHVNCDVRAVRGEKAAYLAKYVSKGGDEIRDFARDNGWESIPSQWWNMSSEAREWVKGALVSGTLVGQVLDYLLHVAFETGDFDDYHYIYHVEIEVDGRLINVGYRGAFAERAYNDLLSALDRELAN
jgi:hypothetical protein